jgi:hypothetical protein
MLIPMGYARFCTFRNHENQELSAANIDSETFAKTFMLTARPRPSSSNQVEKRQSQWDDDKVAGAIFPVDFPAQTAGTLQCICARVSYVSKTAVRGPFSRMLSSASASHFERNKISALNPSRRTVNMLYLREQ